MNFEQDPRTGTALPVDDECAKQAVPLAVDDSRRLCVLVTSAARKVPLILALQQAARAIQPEARVIAGDIDPQALSFHIADESLILPRLDDSKAAIMMKYCHEHGISTVMPTRDGELMFWARHAARFRQADVEVMVSSSEALHRCLDKLAFSEYGAREGLPIIRSALALEELKAKRLVVKERFGAGSRSIGVDLDRAQALAYAASLEEPIFQPFVTGREISIDSWLDRAGHVKGVVLRRRDVVVNGESQITTTFRDTALEEQASNILGRLSLRGPAVIQAIVDDQGNMKVIECNARFGGASTASIAVGLDSLRWSLLEATGANIDDYPFHRSAVEVRQARVPTDIILHDTCL